MALLKGSEAMRFALPAPEASSAHRDSQAHTTSAASQQSSPSTAAHDRHSPGTAQPPSQRQATGAEQHSALAALQQQYELDAGGGSDPVAPQPADEDMAEADSHPRASAQQSIAAASQPAADSDAQLVAAESQEGVPELDPQETASVHAAPEQSAPEPVQHSHAEPMLTHPESAADSLAAHIQDPHAASAAISAACRMPSGEQPPPLLEVQSGATEAPQPLSPSADQLPEPSSKSTSNKAYSPTHELQLHATSAALPAPRNSPHAQPMPLHPDDGTHQPPAGPISGASTYTGASRPASVPSPQPEALISSEGQQQQPESVLQPTSSYSRAGLQSPEPAASSASPPAPLERPGTVQARMADVNAAQPASLPPLCQTEAAPLPGKTASNGHDRLPSPDAAAVSSPPLPTSRRASLADDTGSSPVQQPKPAADGKPRAATVAAPVPTAKPPSRSSSQRQDGALQRSNVDDNPLGPLG